MSWLRRTRAPTQTAAAFAFASGSAQHTQIFHAVYNHLSSYNINRALTHTTHARDFTLQQQTQANNDTTTIKIDLFVPSNFNYGYLDNRPQSRLLVIFSLRSFLTQTLDKR